MGKEGAEDQGEETPSINQRGTPPIARTVYYDRIAKQWHRATGHHGGAFKRNVLNDRVLARLDCIADRAILELGAGNGYFAPLLRRRFSGQIPARLVISDQSRALLDIAASTFALEDAEYLLLDVQNPLPFSDASFDLVLALMLLNELPTSAMRAALVECARVLRPGGQLVAAVPHPAFVHTLAKQGALTDFGRGLFAMPGADGLRLPVSRRPTQIYLDALDSAGFALTAAEDVLPDEQTRHAKPGLKGPRDQPLALLLDARNGGG